MNTPFRYDFVGSFLRPLSLKEARKQFEAGTISKQELVKVEDACIEDLIAKQKTAGYHVITDGCLVKCVKNLPILILIDFAKFFNTI